MTEKFVRYSKQVGSIEEVWTFVMTYIDEFKTKNVEFNTLFNPNADELESIGYSVCIYGVVNE